MTVKVIKAHRRDMAREELYEMVWAMPLTKVGSELGISDVAVRKICIKHKIPRPPQGYWLSARLRKRPRPKLPDVDQYLSIVRINIQERAIVHPVWDETIPEPVDKVIRHGMPKRITRELAFTVKTLRKGSTDQYGFLRPPYGVPVHEVIATRSSLTRALTLLDFIFRVCAADNISILTPEAGSHGLVMRTRVERDDAIISIRVKSEVKRITARSSPRDHYQNPFVYEDTGRLSVTIDGTKVLRERSDKLLDERITEIYQKIVAALEVEKERIKQRARQHRQRQLDYRSHQIALARERIQELRIKNFELYKSDTEKRLDYEQFFVAVGDRGELSNIRGWDDWIEWARGATSYTLHDIAAERVEKDFRLVETLGELEKLDVTDDCINWRDLLIDL